VLRLYCAYCMALYHTHCTQYSRKRRACQGGVQIWQLVGAVAPRRSPPLAGSVEAKIEKKTPTRLFTQSYSPTTQGRGGLCRCEAMWPRGTPRMLCLSVPDDFLSNLAPHRSPPAAGSVDAKIGKNSGAFFSILFTHDARSWGSLQVRGNVAAGHAADAEVWVEMFCVVGYREKQARCRDAPRIFFWFRTADRLLITEYRIPNTVRHALRAGHAAAVAVAIPLYILLYGLSSLWRSLHRWPVPCFVVARFKQLRDLGRTQQPPFACGAARPENVCSPDKMSHQKSGRHSGLGGARTGNGQSMASHCVCDGH